MKYIQNMSRVLGVGFHSGTSEMFRILMFGNYYRTQDLSLGR